MKPGTPTKIAGIAVNAILVLVLLAQAFFLLAPRLTDLKFLTVIGGSMSPAIPLGAVIAVRPVDAAEIQVGDIIAYNSSDPARSTLRVVHRVVAVETDANGSLNFITKGDASGSEDIDVTSEANVIGRSWFSIPLLGYLWSYVRTPWLFILLVAVPGIAIIALEGAGLIAYIQRRKGPLPFPGHLGITAMPLARKTPAGRDGFPASVRKGQLPRQGQKETPLPQGRYGPKGRSASPRATIHLPVVREKVKALPQSKASPKGRGASPRATMRLPVTREKVKALPQSKPSPKGQSASPRATIHLPAMRHKETALPQSKPSLKEWRASPRVTIHLTLMRHEETALLQSKPSPNGRNAWPRATVHLPLLGKRF